MRYSEILNSLENGISSQLTIINRKLKNKELKEIALLQNANDGKDKYRREINDMLTMLANGANAIVQDKYVTPDNPLNENPEPSNGSDNADKKPDKRSNPKNKAERKSEQPKTDNEQKTPTTEKAKSSTVEKPINTPKTEQTKPTVDEKKLPRQQKQTLPKEKEKGTIKKVNNNKSVRAVKVEQKQIKQTNEMMTLDDFKFCIKEANYHLAMVKQCDFRNKRYFKEREICW